MRVTAVTAITPCVGGLVIWYPDHDDVGRQVPEQSDNSDTGTKRRQKPRQ